MKTYKKTVVERRPEYVGKKLLLANRNMNGLFCKNGHTIEIQINKAGQLIVNLIRKNNLKSKALADYSLSKIGRDYLRLRDPSVPLMLKYFILPEVEVERIFNNVRYKYLRAIFLSRLIPPSKFMRSDCNRAFQALAGMTVYQGNTKSRKDNDYFWKTKNFKRQAKEEINWEEDRDAMDFVIRYITEFTHDTSSAYLDLIAIKPGFHEIWMHKEYFEEAPKRFKGMSVADEARNSAFRILRCNNDADETLHIGNMPRGQINRGRYYTYASCNITEGPFVYRKNISVCYSDEIKKVANRKKDIEPPKKRCEEMRRELKRHFHVHDYETPKNKGELKNLICKAERFRYYMCRHNRRK